jgi:hypothetical protein
METSEIEPFTPLISATLRLMLSINIHSNQNNGSKGICLDRVMD